ncbi:MAG: hypothetical protein ALECFALPRED_000087 [Alectoria fallacina]|uniref:CENP-V/GFA domain-containing protein n=1 Tax=Alectoria fallacina TaxID=1903189 RepID=A0A8H3EFF0_9LECA|nr:MAG: hypothetical protein ALECFALPRED_000087 [Alectoria fallacina]
MAASAAAADKSSTYFPLAGCVDDGWSKEDEATATCFCGAVQLAFVSLAPESDHPYTREKPANSLFSLRLPPKISISSALTPHPNPQPTQGPGLVDSFICNCTDCRKITASMFASNFTVADTHLKHLRGRANLTTFSQSRSIASGNNMTNYFCSTCGTLMYRVSSAFPEQSILRIGTVDDFHLHETKLKPTAEQFIESRVGWLNGVEGVKQVRGSH